jgi:hypothetical protein
MPLDSVKFVPEFFESLVVYRTPRGRERDNALGRRVVEPHEVFESVTRQGTQGVPVTGLLPLEPFRIIGQSGELRGPGSRY